MSTLTLNESLVIAFLHWADVHKCDFEAKVAVDHPALLLPPEITQTMISTPRSYPGFTSRVMVLRCTQEIPKVVRTEGVLFYLSDILKGRGTLVPFDAWISVTPYLSPRREITLYPKIDSTLYPGDYVADSDSSEIPKTTH